MQIEYLSNPTCFRDRDTGTQLFFCRLTELSAALAKYEGQLALGIQTNGITEENLDKLMSKVLMDIQKNPSSEIVVFRDQFGTWYMAGDLLPYIDQTKARGIELMQEPIDWDLDMDELADIAAQAKPLFVHLYAIDNLRMQYLEHLRCDRPLAAQEKTNSLPASKPT